MKGKTFLELLTLSTTLYAISKEKHLMDKIKDISQQGKDKINSFVKEKVLDDDGNEVEFLEKLSMKAKEAKEGLEEKIGEMVEKLYTKMNLVHVHKIESLEKEINNLKLKLTKLEKDLKNT